MILSIGACMVQRSDDGFYKKLLPYEFEVSLFHVDKKTIDWWQTQPEEARKEAFSGQELLHKTLDDFSAWFPADAIIWSNGASFDIPILTYAYGVLGKKVPWGYRNMGCYKTLRQLLDYKEERPADAPKHIAIYDAKFQAECLLKMLHKLHFEYRHEGEFFGTHD
jgi:hypothetical protein